AVFGSAIYLDGSAGSMVKLPEDASLCFGTGDFSFEVWIKPAAFGDNMRWLDKSNYPAEWWVVDIYTDGRIEMEMADANGKGGTTSSNGSLQLNKWNHLVIAIDRKNFKANYYLNGNLDSSKNISSAFTGSLDSSGKEVTIGTDWAGHCFTGFLDEFKMYTRCLSAPEVKNSYSRNCVIDFVPRPVSEFTSYLRTPYPDRGKFPAGATAACAVAVYAADEFNVPMAGQQVTVYTSRGSSFDTITYPAGNIIGADGFCTAVIISSYAGADTITARCNGVTITENIVNNPSLEAGTGTPSGWLPAGSTWTWTSAAKYSGNRSLAVHKTVAEDHYVDAQWYIPSLADKYPVSPNTPYKISQYCRTDNLTGEYANLRLVWWKGDVYPDDYLGEAVFAGMNGTKGWTLQTTVSVMSAATTFLMYRFSVGQAEGTAWFDCVRMQRIPTINWTADRFSFTSSAQNILCGSISKQIKVSATGAETAADITFNDTALLFTSSESGHFSIFFVPWIDITKVSFVSGQASFYYRDYCSGNAVITVSRNDLGMLPGLQTEKIGAASIVIASLPFRISTGESAPVIVEARNSDSSVDTTFNDSVRFSTTSEKGKFSASNTSWKDTTSLYLSSGTGTVFYRDRISGSPSIVMVCADLNISDTQQETVVQPVITIEKQMFNESKGETGVLTQISNGDTLVYILTVSNLGTNTAIEVVITDTVVFNTSVYVPLFFLSMDTFPADTWSYMDADGIWQPWGSVPPGSDIKGLRWLISTLGVGEARVVRFRVRVK
ncbi:hypothetical protein CO111_05700, partial [Candidatus Desantisbacteria bacterium CG_4_9_14_3_um_filter_50_7]